jgi:predicted ArsR family transcriptional regulator
MAKTLEQAFFQTLNEKQKRLFAGLKANELGYFGVRQVSQQLGIHPHTVRAGQKELADLSTSELTSTRIRKPGGGRKKTRN